MSRVKTRLGIWVQGDAAFSVCCLHRPSRRATDARGIWRHQAASDKPTHPLSSSFWVRAAHHQDSHLHPRSLNMDVYNLKRPWDQRLRHLPQQTHHPRFFWVPQPLESYSATENSDNFTDVLSYICLVWWHAISWRNWDPPVWLQRWLL